MEFFKSPARRMRLSEAAYYFLNLALAGGVLVLSATLETPLAALALFLVSKWRIFAVRPRYWFAHLQANLVDIIVGVSTVILINQTGSLAIQGVVASLFAIWLLFVKPRSSRTFVAIQAGTALFLGINATLAIAYSVDSSVTVAAMWLIGYASARHVISSYDDTHRLFISLVWGLVMAELGWLAYHWSIAYFLPGTGGLQVAQASLIGLMLSFMAERVYSSYMTHENGLRAADIILPLLLGTVMILVLLIAFNNPPTDSMLSAKFKPVLLV